MKRLFSNWLLPFALSLSLFSFVVGVHWSAFDKFGSDIPNWDQWDAEGLYLLAPFFEKDHFAEHLFHPHNEHRVVITKLQNLGLTILDGQWDARLEAISNALVHAALAVAFWVVGPRWLAARWHAVFFVTMAALFGAPVAWQNILGGFHSQQYWLLLLSFLAMVSLPFARTWSARWFFGVAMATLAMFTMGSGLFAAAMVLGVVVVRLLRKTTTLRAAWPTVAFTLTLVVVGLVTRVEVYYHEALKAKTANDYFLSMIHSLQWPAPRAYSWLALLLWLPWLLVAWRIVRDKTESTAALTILAFGGWVLTQILATAYARGAGGDYPASRYMDTLAFGMGANALAVGWLLSSAAASRWQGVARGIIAACWLGVLAWGIYDLARLAIVVEMPDAKRFCVKAEAHMKEFLASNDPANLANEDIPYPGAESLMQRLAHESLHSRMPMSIRAPLPMKPAASADATFVENVAPQLKLDTAPRRGLSPNTGALPSHKTWGTFGASGPRATGEWSSAPLTAPLNAWLVFETAGDIGRDGVALELRDAKTNSLLASVLPSKIPGDAWRAAYVRAPHVPFVVVARDESSTRWMAFSAPVEMGKLSYVAWQFAKHGALVAQLAAAAAALLGLAALASRRNDTSAIG